MELERCLLGRRHTFRSRLLSCEWAASEVGARMVGTKPIMRMFSDLKRSVVGWCVVASGGSGCTGASARDARSTSLSRTCQGQPVVVELEHAVLCSGALAHGRVPKEAEWS